MSLKLAPLFVVLLFTPSATAYGGFSDVPRDAFYADAVAWMGGEGITTGYAPGCFGPDLPITRGDALVLLWRAEDKPTTGAALPFDDVTGYHTPAVRWAVDAGITTGVTASEFRPDALITRGDLITLLARSAGGFDPAAASRFGDVTAAYQRGPVGWAFTNGITMGTSPTTFSPNRPVSRGEAATFIWRLEGEPTVVDDRFDDFCRDGFADADCIPDDAGQVGWRGAGVSSSQLTDRRSGEVTITRNGTVLDYFDITGTIVVEADNVTIRRGRVRFAGDSTFGVIQNFGRNLVIEDVEIDGAAAAANGVWRDNYTARRLDVHDVASDAFKAHGDVLIEQVVAHDRFGGSVNAHADGVQIQYGSNITIRCSRIEWGIPDGFGPDDVGRSVSIGQGIWLAYNSGGGGSRIDDVTIENVVVVGTGHPIGWQTESVGRICDVVATSDQGWEVFHTSNASPDGSLAYGRVVDGNTGRQVSAPSGASITGCG